MSLFNQSVVAQQSDPVVLDSITVEGEGPRTADDGFVPERSTSGSKTNSSILETPQTISVVPRKQMEAQAPNLVSEALRYTPGVLAESNGYDVRYDWLWIRGFNANGTMWQDGLVMPGDPNSYATPTVHPYALERVEVIKGPASVLYGRTVPSGLINQVSKRPQATPYREASISTSGFGGIQGAVDMTGPVTQEGNLLYRFTGLAKNMHTQIDKERDRKIMLAPSLTWKMTDDTSITAYGYYQRDRDVFSPRFYPAIGTLLPNPAGQIPRDLFLGDTNAEEFNRDYYALGYEFSHRFNEALEFRQNLRYGRANQDMFLALVNPAFAYSGPPSSRLNRVAAVSDDWVSTFTADTQLEAKVRTGSVAHTLLFGVDYVYGISDTKFGNSAQTDPLPPPLDFLNPSYGYTIAMPAFQRSGRQAQDQVGFYVQDQFRYDRWVGTVGLRYDRSEIDTDNRFTGTSVTTQDHELTGRVGLTYLFDNGLAPYASYSTSFLPVMGTDRGGAPFEAQTAEQYEVGVKYAPPGWSSMVTLSLFDLTIDKGLTPDPASTLFQVQGGRQNIRGLELEGRVSLGESTDLLVAYAYSDSEVKRSTSAAAVGREMLRVPKHQGSAWVNHRLAAVPGLSVSAGVRATSSYQSDSTYLADLRIPGRALVDLGAVYDLGGIRKELEGTSLQVNVANLFDREYVSHCLNRTGGSCNYGAGRSVFATLKYTW